MCFPNHLDEIGWNKVDYWVDVDTESVDGYKYYKYYVNSELKMKLKTHYKEERC